MGLCGFVTCAVGQILLRLPEGLLHRFAQIIGRSDVHVHLAHIAVKAALLHAADQIRGSFPMDGGKNAGMEGAVPDHIVNEGVIDRPGVVHVRKAGLLREGVLIQPVRQKHVHSKASLDILGSMDMQVRKGGNNHAFAVVRDLCAFILLRKNAADFPDFSVFHNQITVFIGDQLVVAF